MPAYGGGSEEYSFLQFESEQRERGKVEFHIWLLAEATWWIRKSCPLLGVGMGACLKASLLLLTQLNM